MTTPHQPRLLHRAGNTHIFHRPGTSPWTLVVFGPRQTAVRDDLWWGAGLGRREGIDVVGVATTDFDWFPRDVMEAVMPAIRAAAKPNVVTFGFGMGGYGALKYATALGARAALGFSAQYSIDPADGASDDRGTTYFDPDRHAGMRLAPGDYPEGGSLVLWDPVIPADDQHARAIAALPGMRAVPLRLTGQATAAVFSETRQLLPVCEHLLAGRREEAVGVVRRARRKSPTVLLSAAALLEAHGHTRWAEQALERAGQRRADPTRTAEARAVAPARRPAAEIAALRARIEAAPQDLEPRLRLVERLRALGRPAEAAAAARTAITAGITDDRLQGALHDAAEEVDRAPPAATRPERPAPQLLAETESIRLWIWPGEGPGNLVIFTPPGGAPAGPGNWWGQGHAAQLGWTTLVFAAHRPSWYPATEMAALLPQALAALPRGPRITYGTGMGGYGALKFARMLSAKASVALAPVFSIDPADMPRDPRAQRQFDAERNAGMAIRRNEIARLAVIAYDPLIRADRAQARRLAALPRVLSVPIRRGGAGLAGTLVEGGGILPLLRAALAEDGPGAVAALRAARRRSPTLRKALAAAAEARGHARWARALRSEETVAVPSPAAASQPAAADRHFVIQANALRMQRKHEAEEAVLRRWMAANPTAPAPRIALAHCLRTLGRPRMAAECLFAALRDEVWDETVYAALAGQLPRLEYSKELAAVAAAALTGVPRDAGSLALVGEIALWSGQLAAAEQAFLAALEREPGHRIALRGLAVTEPDPALDGAAGPYLARLLSTLEQNDAPEIEWAAAIERLSQGGRQVAAVLAGRAALSMHPASLRLTRQIGHNLLVVEREEEAIAHFRRLADLQPQQIQSWFGLTDALMRLRRHEEARAALTEALALHPQDATLITRHAACLLALEATAEAEQEVRRALVLDPMAEVGHLVLLDVLRRQDRRREAIAAAEAALEALPEAPHVAQRLGRLLTERGQHDAAADAFERAIGQMTKAPRGLWVELAQALNAAGRPEAAEAMVQRGLAAHPGAQELRVILGQMLLRRGETEAARDALAAAIDEDAESAAVSLAMAEALLLQGRKREALALLEATVASAPDHRPAELRLGQLLLDAGRVPEAATLFTRLTEAEPGLAMAWVGLSDAERLRKQVKPALAAYRAAIAAGVDRQTLRNLRYRLFGEYDG